MALNMQIFQQLGKQATRKNNAKYNNNIKKTPHAYTQEENPRKIQNNRVKAIIIPNST
jgi:hypothetical protein